MIHHLELKNFKCFKCLNFDFRKITVLVGKNGSGKSSLVQALMCLKQLSSSTSALDLQSLDIGTFRDMYYQFNQSSDSTIRIGVDGSSYEFDYKVELSGLNRLTSNGMLFLEGPYRRGSQECIVNARRLVADRNGPRSVHSYQEVEVSLRDLGLHGENAVAFLAKNSETPVLSEFRLRNRQNGSDELSLQNQVSAWLQEFTEGVSVRAEKTDAVDQAILSFDFGSAEMGRTFRPENVGVGLSRVLPVLVLVLSAQRGDLLVIENPETDLHPRGQSRLSELFARAAKAGVQVVIETHSDHVINGLRVAVKGGKHLIDECDVRFAFFTRRTDPVTGEQFSTFENLEMDEYGEFVRYPRDFLDEWGRQMNALLGAPDSNAEEEGSGNGIES